MSTPIRRERARAFAIERRDRRHPADDHERRTRSPVRDCRSSASSASGSGSRADRCARACARSSILGVLETRQGDGTYVTSLEPSQLFEPLGILAELQSPENSVHLLGVRRVLEPEAAARAALLISDEDLAEARRILDHGEGLLADEDDRPRGDDRRRHRLPPPHRERERQPGLRRDHRGARRPHGARPAVAGDPPARRRAGHPARAPGDPRRAHGARPRAGPHPHGGARARRRGVHGEPSRLRPSSHRGLTTSGIAREPSLGEHAPEVLRESAPP